MTVISLFTDMAGNTPFLGAYLVAQVVKKSACNAGSRFGLIPWQREWLPTPVFLPGEFHGHRSLVGYSPWGHKELDTIEQLTLPLFTLRLT